MASTPATSLTLVSSGLPESRLQPPLGRPEISQFVTVVRKPLDGPPNTVESTLMVFLPLVLKLV